MNVIDVSDCTASLDVVFLLDATESMDYDYDVTQMMARRIADGLNYAIGRTRLGLITFQQEATLRFSLDTYTEKVG